MIEACSILSKEDPDFKFSGFQKEAINEFISNKKAWLSKFNEKLFSLIDLFLSELLIEFNKQYAFLTSEEVKE